MIILMILSIVLAAIFGGFIGWFLAAMFWRGKRIDQALENEKAKRN